MYRNKLMAAVLAAGALAGPQMTEAACDSIGHVRAENSASRWMRPVEDFTVPQGAGGVSRIRSMTASIATNVPPGFEVWFEIYSASALGTPGTRIFSARATSVVTTSHANTVTINGQVHKKYTAHVTFANPVIPELRPGQKIFVGAYVKSSFTATQSAWVTRSSDQPDSPGLTRIQLSPNGGWSSLPASDCDLGVSLELKHYCPADFNRDGVVNSVDAQLFYAAYTARYGSADFNRSGSVTTADLAAFIGAYQSPCNQF